MDGAPKELEPGLPRTLPQLLEWQARAHGDRPLVRFGGLERSVAAMRDVAAGYAGTLADAGIQPGDRVAVLSENRLEVLDLWVGCAWLGAVLVPVNAGLRGAQLAHVLEDSGARLLAVEATLIPHLDALEHTLPALERLWILGDGTGASRRDVPQESFPSPAPPLPPVEARPGDTSMILYTSGTTGPAKGVLCPHAQWYWWGTMTGEVLGVEAGDVLYTCLPLFHTNALNTFMQALTAGATFVPGARFSASAFWTRLAESEATVTYLLGAMVHILGNRPPDPLERSHRVRIALAPATPAPLHESFRARFGIRLVDGWGSTETNVVLSTAEPGSPPGSMGTVVRSFRARVVDADDDEVGPGVPGELVVRNDEPFAFASGYHGLPEKTVEAWRNLWFHTGDRVLRDAEGWFWFLDRLSDSIRRRGENISSYEVESALSAHADVAAAAVVPVPAEVGEDDVLAFIVLREGAQLEPEALIAFCEPRLASFAIPRYLEFVTELPLTANGKVEKYRLREAGVGPGTWDRERSRYLPRKNVDGEAGVLRRGK